MKYLILNIIKEIYRYFFYKKNREFYGLYDKYSKKPRHQYTQNIRFLNYVIDVPDLLSFIWQYKELYLEEIYKFSSKQDESIIIIDCGANIGLSCIYFKSLFSNVIIKAFEADPQIAEILKNNLIKNHINDVEVISKAVWIHNDGIEFVSDGADGGSISANGNKKKVLSISLKEYLRKFNHISLLKIDIEGAEYEVLKDCSEDLLHVENIFIEYHSWNGKSQKLSEILEILEKNKFRYYIEDITKRKNPFLNRGVDLNMDLQLNIFGYKND